MTLNILFCSGDIGGAVLLKNLIVNNVFKKFNIFILKNGSLPELGFNSIEVTFIEKEMVYATLRDVKFSCFIFTSSVNDRFPLSIASFLKNNTDVKIIHFLDNWMNYKKRLELKGKIVTPDYYFVLDEYSKEKVVAAGFDHKTVKLYAHPVLLENLAKNRLRNEERVLMNRKLNLVFISEPRFSDYPECVKSNSTQYDYFRILLNGIKIVAKKLKFLKSIDITVALHPREIEQKIKPNFKDTFKKNSLENFQLKFSRGEKTIKALKNSDIVFGLSSILLVECSSQGKKTVVFYDDANSLNNDYLLQLEGVTCTNGEEEFFYKLSEFFEAAFAKKIYKSATYSKKSVTLEYEMRQLENKILTYVGD